MLQLLHRVLFCGLTRISSIESVTAELKFAIMESRSMFPSSSVRSGSNFPLIVAWKVSTTAESSVFPAEIDIKVTLKSKHARGKRFADSYPEEIDIEIPVNTDHVTLALHRNDHISNQVPVTVVRSGKIIAQHLIEKQSVAYYYDLRNGSAFMVQYSKRKIPENQLEFFGTMFIGSELYIVQPPDEYHKTHSLFRVTEENPVYGDYKTIPGNDILKRTPSGKYTSRHGRHKRQTIIYEVEVLMVVDFSIYSFWLERASGTTLAERDNDAKKDITEYFALLLDAIDVRYSTVTGRGYEIKLLFAGLHIADTAADAIWTEPYKNTATDPAQVNSDTTIESFRSWINDNIEGLPGNDHAMLFTGYDLEREGKTSVAGYAYVGGLCGENKVSVNEDKFHATGATVAAHELGHNLNASHDGDGNACTIDLGYVMESSVGVSSDSNDNKRLWEFSSCSQDYFDSFISAMNSESSNCMQNRSASYNASALDEYENSLLGQIYPPDVQCGRIIGNGSYLCRQTFDYNYTNICAKMSCSDLRNNGTCWLKVPYEGTSCGDGKICSGSNCVDSDLAPVGLTETCLFGDQPGDINNENKTCNELIALEENHYKCYSSYYDERCCETCATVAGLYSNLTGCQYGDKQSWCSDLEARSCYSNDANCCHRCRQFDTGIEGCEYGDKQSWCSDLEARECYLNDEPCCQRCLQFKTDIEGCQYGDKQTWCSDLEARSCYSNDENCCHRCRQFDTGIEGCKYGDRSSQCDVTKCSNYDENSRTVECCLTCADPTTTTSSTSSTQRTTTSLVVASSTTASATTSAIDSSSRSSPTNLSTIMTPTASSIATTFTSASSATDSSSRSSPTTLSTVMTHTASSTATSISSAASTISQTDSSFRSSSTTSTVIMPTASSITTNPATVSVITTSTTAFIVSSDKTTQSIYSPTTITVASTTTGASTNVTQTTPRTAATTANVESTTASQQFKNDSTFLSHTNTQKVLSLVVVFGLYFFLSL